MREQDQMLHLRSAVMLWRDRCGRRGLSFCALTAILLVVWAPPSLAAEVTGMVTSVEGSRVRIAVADAGSVRLGDPVELAGELPGVGFLALDGTWRVVGIEVGVVIAELEDRASGRPQPGYRAVIRSGGSTLASRPATPTSGEVAPTPPRGGDSTSGRPWLGVSLDPVGGGEGVGILSVTADSPAGRAGLQAGDRILAFNGKTTSKGVELIWAIDAARLGTPVPLTIRRQGRDQTMTVRLTVRDDAQAKLSEAYAALARKDYQAAMRLFESLAKAGEAEAQGNVAYLYMNGLGVEVDLAQAAYWCHRSPVEEMIPTCQLYLGWMYAQGEGVGIDLEEAAGLYRLAAEAGNLDAMARLGVAYHEGYGVTKDLAMAAYWDQKAADLGYAKSQYSIGMKYYLGLGVRQDPAKARDWLQKAAAQDYEPAKEMLRDMK